MTSNTVVQFLLYFVVLIGLGYPLGTYMARVYEGERVWLTRVFGPLERFIYRLAGTREDEEQTWQTYAVAMLLFNAAGLLVVYALQRLQAALPLNPQAMPAVTPDSSFNTAVSFATNTNWQGYGGESTMSYLTQMLGLTVQNFVSAASGMAILIAVIRGFTRKQSKTIGNFWVDLVRGTLYVLVPLSLVVALILVSQGVVQTFSAYPTATLLHPFKGADGKDVLNQLIAVGPAASQIAIKQLGTNGGGFFNVNSAHPFENATALSNFVEVISILLVAGALCFTFGKMVKDMRQGWALLAAMMIILVPLLVLCAYAEQAGNPALNALGVDQVASALHSGGNMEGKEARYGITNSTLWAAATTAASNGSVNSMHDSFTPLGGLVPLWLIQLGEIVFGGVGSGLYGMLMFAIVAVFVAGLMVGRTPEYLGKKIEAKDVKLAMLTVLIFAAFVLIGSAIAAVTNAGTSSLNNGGPHGLSELTYAFTSATGNNGSAFAGLNANTRFYNLALGLAMFFGRFFMIIPVMAIAGSLASKKRVAESAGTFPVDGPLFTILLAGVIVIVGALTYFPMLSLGPIVEHFLMTAGEVF